MFFAGSVSAYMQASLKVSHCVASSTDIKGREKGGRDEGERGGRDGRMRKGRREREEVREEKGEVGGEEV